MKKQISNLKDIIWTSGISVLIAIALQAVTVYALKLDYLRYLKSEAEQALVQVENISHDVFYALRDLNNEVLPDCSANTLIEMRKKQFLSTYIKDIGLFIDDKLACTTGLGNISGEYRDDEPEFVDKSGARVWTNKQLLLFGEQIEGIVIRYQHYNAVIEQKLTQGLLKDDFYWELVHSFGNNPTHVSGNRTLYSASPQETVKTLSFFESVCSKEVPYCIGIAAEPFQFNARYQNTLVVSYLAAFLAFVAMYLIIMRVFIKRRSIEARVRRGINQGAFYCQYQPIVDLKTENLVGCEVLARFKDLHGVLYPNEFIPVISKLGLSKPFTSNILIQVYNDAMEQLKVDSDFKVNINFFPQDISSGEILDLLNHNYVGNFPCQLVAEMTEDELIASETSIDVINTLIQRNVLVAIDDFGTGYSNLRQVRDFDCYCLKIDRSFVSEMEEGSIRSTLVPHMVDIAKKVGANVVAEGIENRMQKQALLDIGVTYGQGWLFGKPVNVDAFATQLESQTQTVSAKP